MIYSKVDDFFNWLFKDLNGKFDFRIVVTLLIGILLGIVITSLIYGIILLSSLKKVKKDNPVIIQESILDDRELLDLVKTIKKDFQDLTLTFSPTEKIKYLGTTVYNTMKRIASTYYPHSKYPLYELNIDEILILFHYISDRINIIFDKKILKPFKVMSISQIFNALDSYKRIQENKAVKTFQKTGKIRNAFFSLINYANPVYWLKKLVINGTIQTAVNKMCLIIIDIVADETIKVYSKRIFNVERNILNDEIEKEIKEMEELQ